MAVFTKLLKEDIEKFIFDYSIGNLNSFEASSSIAGMKDHSNKSGTPSLINLLKA